MSQHRVYIHDPGSYSSHLVGQQVAICTLGVGQPSQVSKAEFTRVDKDAVLAFAKACRAAGVKHFKRLSLFQPSMILTPSNRYGWSQSLTLAIWPKLDGFLSGRWMRFRGIAVAELGWAMAANALKEGSGVEILQWSDFKRLARHNT